MRYWHRWKAGYVRLLALQRRQRTHARTHAYGATMAAARLIVASTLKSCGDQRGHLQRS